MKNILVVLCCVQAQVEEKWGNVYNKLHHDLEYDPEWEPEYTKDPEETLPSDIPVIPFDEVTDDSNTEQNINKEDDE